MKKSAAGFRKRPSWAVPAWAVVGGLLLLYLALASQCLDIPDVGVVEMTPVYPAILWLEHKTPYSIPFTVSLGEQPFFLGSWPWMVDSSQGALGVYALAVSMKLWGVSLAVVRWTSVWIFVLGAAGWIGLAWDLFGEGPAVVSAALILFSAYSFWLGFLDIQGNMWWLLMGWHMRFVGRWLRGGGPLWLYAGAVLAGLLVYNTPVTVWFWGLEALAWRWVLKERAGFSWRMRLNYAGFLALGALPWLAYILRSPGALAYGLWPDLFGNYTLEPGWRSLWSGLREEAAAYYDWLPILWKEQIHIPAAGGYPWENLNWISPILILASLLPPVFRKIPEKRGYVFLAVLLVLCSIWPLWGGDIYLWLPWAYVCASAVLCVLVSRLSFALLCSVFLLLPSFSLGLRLSDPSRPTPFWRALMPPRGDVLRNAAYYLRCQNFRRPVVCMGGYAQGILGLYAGEEIFKDGIVPFWDMKPPQILAYMRKLLRERPDAVYILQPKNDPRLGPRWVTGMPSYLRWAAKREGLGWAETLVPGTLDLISIGQALKKS